MSQDGTDSDAPVSRFNLTFADDADRVPFHARDGVSSSMHYYKRILPQQLVRLWEGADLIVVIRPLNQSAAEVERKEHNAIAKDINTVLLSSCQGLQREERDSQLKTILRTHEMKRDGGDCLEFQMRLKNWPEREQLDTLNASPALLDHFWGSGAGLRFHICGYSTNKSVLFKLRHCHHLEFYLRTNDGNVLNDDIKFQDTGNPARLADPLLDQLFLMKGCKLSCLEIMMKYYKADAMALRRIKSKMDKAKAEGIKSSNESEEARVHNYLFDAMKDELSEDRLYKFTRKVDSVYYDHMLKHYSGFTKITDTALSPAEENEMYLQYCESFPTCHAVFSQIVSASSFRVELATAFGEFEYSPVVDVGDTCDDTDDACNNTDDACDDTDDASDNNDDPPTYDIPPTDATVNELWVDEDIDTNKADDVHDKPQEDLNSSKKNGLLHKKEKACLEYFLAMIRIRSQKQLSYWAMLSPLAHHCKGYLQPGTKNPLLGVGCNIKTAWHKMDKIFEECTPARMALIKRQLTITLVFDNWQRMINKLWQDQGKSSVYQRGTAFFVKQDKAFSLPVGTVMESSSGLLFTVTSCTEIDPYTYMIIGELVPFPVIADKKDSYDAMLSEVRVIAVEGFMWPRIGWSVSSIPGLEKCQDIRYGMDQHIPAPLGATVGHDVLSDDILTSKRELGAAVGITTRIIPTAEGHSLFVRAQQLNELDGYAEYLKTHYASDNEVTQQIEEEGAQSTTQPIINPVPRNKIKDDLFLGIMKDSSKQMHYVRTFERDILNVINPQRKVQDKFHFFPICPREETSTKGMLLTSATLNESLGLLDKLPSGGFGLDVNAMKRKVAMHGDALSCITHTNSKIAIAKKGTVPGNERLVNDLLGAHSRIDMQKGLFHQLMHQCAVVYIKYYGGFMQPMQVALAKKRVKGDPVKSHFQDHDKHQMELYHAARRFRFAMFIESLTVEDLEHDRSLEGGKPLLSLEGKMKQFCEDFETSDHEPSRVVALYLKDVSSYS